MTVNKVELFKILKKMFPPRFEELIFLLEIPQEYLPPSEKPQIERAMKLLEWAEKEGGGLKSIKQALELMEIDGKRSDKEDTPLSDVIQPVTSPLTEIQRRHLEQQLKEQQKEYNYSNEEIEFLSDAEKKQDLRPKELWRLKQQIAEAKRKRDEAAQQIEELEKKLNW